MLKLYIVQLVVRIFRALHLFRVCVWSVAIVIVFIDIFSHDMSDVWTQRTHTWYGNTLQILFCLAVVSVASVTTTTSAIKRRPMSGLKTNIKGMFLLLLLATILLVFAVMFWLVNAFNKMKFQWWYLPSNRFHSVQLNTNWSPLLHFMTNLRALVAYRIVYVMQLSSFAFNHSKSFMFVAFQTFQRIQLTSNSTRKKYNWFLIETIIRVFSKMSAPQSI